MHILLMDTNTLYNMITIIYTIILRAAEPDPNGDQTVGRSGQEGFVDSWA